MKSFVDRLCNTKKLEGLGLKYTYLEERFASKVSEIIYGIKISKVKHFSLGHTLDMKRKKSRLIPLSIIGVRCGLLEIISS